MGSILGFQSHTGARRLHPLLAFKQMWVLDPVSGASLLAANLAHVGGKEDGLPPAASPAGSSTHRGLCWVLPSQPKASPHGPRVPEPALRAKLGNLVR